MKYDAMREREFFIDLDSSNRMGETVRKRIDISINTLCDVIS